MKTSLLFWCAEVVAFLATTTSWCHATAFVRGAYYRLGDEDPGAISGQVGDDPTLDSFADHLGLTRLGSPKYSSNVPVRGPLDDRFSMQFGTIAGPTILGFYGRTDSASMDQQGFALETWVEASPMGRDAPGAATPADLIAYNGTPGTNGFGFFQSGNDYLARIGAFDRVLGPAEIGAWHHLAYVYALGTEDYYYDGKLVFDTTKDPVPTAATGGFWIGGHGTLDNPDSLFSGWVDEVRYQSFNPMAAGLFDPTAFLISVPEPGMGLIVLAIAGAALARRRGAQGV